MFRWWPTKRFARPDLPRISGTSEFDRLMRLDVAIVFKHSPACFISWAAHSEVVRFAEKNPAVPVYLVSVLEDRELSHLIADRTGVRNASPQVLLLWQGAVEFTASHDMVTANYLAWMLARGRDHKLVF